MENKPGLTIDAVGIKGRYLTVTFNDGDMGTYSPDELLGLATDNETLACLRDPGGAEKTDRDR